MTTELAVVVPTFNRSESLTRLLLSLERQTLPADCYEVVVVDNDSTDATHAAVAGFARSARIRVRCLRETAQGASHARNRGIAESTAPVLAFTDDDVEADPAWLEEILKGLHTHTAAAVGGRTLPVWGAPLPAWWHPDYERAFRKDWGEEARPVSDFPFFYSHNLAILREPLLAAGLFDTRLGPKAGRHLVGEDADLCRRIHESGGTLYYLPAAIVAHHVEPARMTRSFLRRRYYYGGMTHAIHREVQSHPFHLPYQVKVIASTFPTWLVGRDPIARFRNELQIWYRLGFLAMGLRRALASPGRPVTNRTGTEEADRPV